MKDNTVSTVTMVFNDALVMGLFGGIYPVIYVNVYQIQILYFP